MLRTLALVAALLAAPSWALEKVDAHHPASRDARIEIQNMAGSTKIVGWDRDEVAVTGELGAGAQDVDISGNKRRIQIEVEVEGNPNDVRSDLEIHVPRASRIEVDSHSADVTVSDTTGALHVESMSGNIVVTSGSTEVYAESVTGNITLSLSGATSHIHAEAVNGSVKIQGAGGELEASTVNGNVDVVGGSLQQGHIETVSGSIRFEGDVTGEAELSVETVSGSVDLAFPEKVSADFEISTFSGDIDNELSTEEAHYTSRHTSEKELSFSVGKGTGKVTAKSLSGSVRIRKH
jgi:DUF4097 and DUF4098 domain-containing protein YvlB